VGLDAHTTGELMQLSSDTITRVTLDKVKDFVLCKGWYAAKIYKLDLDAITWVMPRFRTNHVQALEHLRIMYFRVLITEGKII